MNDDGSLERLVRIETKLDIANDSNLARVKLEDERHSDHEVRIRRIERSMWILAGAAAAGGSVIGSLIAPLLGVA